MIVVHAKTFSICSLQMHGFNFQSLLCERIKQQNYPQQNNMIIFVPNHRSAICSWSYNLFSACRNFKIGSAYSSMIS